MKKFKIVIRNRQSCKIALNWYKKKAVIGDDGGKKITLSSLIDFLHDMAVDELLFKNIAITPLVPEYIKRNILNKAVTRWLRFKKYKNSSDIVSAFEKALFVELGRNLKQKDFKVIGLLNISNKDNQFDHSFELDGCEIETSSWNEIDKIDLNPVWQNAQKHLPKSLDTIFNDLARITSIFSPVIINVTTYDKRDALYQADRCLDFFRVALNFATATNLFVKFGDIYPLAKISPSPVFAVLDSEDNLIYDAYSEAHYNYLKQETITENEYSAFEKIVEGIATQNGLWKLISRLLYLYQQALDLSNGAEIFLALWRIMEASVLDTPEQSVNIKARVSRLTEIEKDPILDHSLIALEKYRNNLVHRGDFPVNCDPLIFTLKKIVDVTLYKLIFLTKHINDETELREYLSLLSTNDKDLNRKSKVVNMLLAERNK